MIDSTARLLGFRVQLARHSKKLSQEFLASATHMYPNQISNIENGKHGSMRLSRLSELADTLGVTTDYLLGRTDK